MHPQINPLDNLQGITELDRPIYRIFDPMRFQDIVIHGRNGLVRPYLWDDPMEDIFASCYVVGRDGERTTLQHLGDQWFGQCWTYNRETDAMWRIYRSQKDGVRLMTTPRKLFEDYWQKAGVGAEKQCFIGDVRYLSQEEIFEHVRSTFWRDMEHYMEPEGTVKAVLMKRPEFQHENEIRLLHYAYKSGSSTEKVFEYPFNVNEVITEICFDPRLSKSLVKRYTARYRRLGIEVPIIQSDLYSLRELVLNRPDNAETRTIPGTWDLPWRRRKG